MTPASAQEGLSHLTLIRLSAYGFGMIGFLLAMDVIILPVFVLEVAPEEFKNSYLGALGFAGLILAGPAQPLVGWASDRTRTPLGRRVPYLIWGCVFVCLGLVGLGLSPNFPVMLGVWLFIQTNFNIGYGPYQALIRDLVPASRIGVASSIKILSDAVGSIVLIYVSSVLISRSGGFGAIDWQWLTLGLIALVLILSTFITSVTVRAKEAVASLARSATETLLAPASGLHPQLSRFLLSRLMFICAITAFPTYGLFFLRDSVGLENPAQALGRMILVIGGALALSVYPAGRLSDKIGRKPVVFAGAAAAAASTIMLLWANSAVDVLWIASLLGASVGTVMTSSWALANDLGTKGREGLHMGIVNLATTGGSASAKLFGPVIDLLNRTADDAGYQALLITCASLFVIGALLLLPLKAQHQELLPSLEPVEGGG